MDVPVPVYFEEKMRAGLRVLSVDAAHATAIERLPFHHRDPFDRLLVAQAELERLTLISSDPVFLQYGIDVLW